MAAEGKGEGRLKRAARVWLALLKTGLTRDLGFRGHFLVYLVTESLWLGLLLIFFSAIFRASSNLGGWTKPQVLVLIGTYHALTQSFEALFFGNLAQLSELVRTGRLDGILAKPVSPQFLVSVQKVEWGGLLQAGLGLLIALGASRQAGVHLTPLLLVSYLLFVLCGLAVLYSLMLSISSAAFWTVRTEDFLTLWYEVTEFARYPSAIYGPFVKAVLTFGVPLLIVTNVPARVLAFGELNAMCLASPVAAALSLAASSWIFERGLGRYHSASS